MGLSKQEKEQLHDFYRNKDLYDPSKAPEQEVADFRPKGMCHGGAVNMDDGGMVPYLNMTLPDLQSSLDEQQNIAPAVSEPMRDALVNKVKPAPIATQSPLLPAGAGVRLTPDQQESKAADLQASVKSEKPPMASPVKSLQPDEYSQLVQALSQRPSMGQGAMSALAGLADAIETGVARSGGSNFQKNIMESQQQQKQNLINAMREKYEAGFRGKQLSSEEQRAANTIAAENKRAALSQTGENSREKARIAAEKERTGAELGIRSKEAELGRQQSGIEAAAKLPATGILHPSTWGNGSVIEAVRQQLLGQGKNQASAPMTATNKMGHKIISMDGGKTWKPMQ